MTNFPVSKMFFVAALIVFVLAVFSVSLGSLALLPLGLALMCVGFIL